MLTESKLRKESTNSSMVFMSNEKSMNISDFNNTDLVASTPRPVVVIKGQKSTTVYNDTESHTAANISTNHTGLSSHLNQSIVIHKVSRSTQTSNKTIQPHDTSLATTAYVKVVWKSQTREKVLPPDLTSVGTTLCSIFLLTGLRIYMGEYKAQGPTLCPTEGRALRGPRTLYSPV